MSVPLMRILECGLVKTLVAFSPPSLDQKRLRIFANTVLAPQTRVCDEWEREVEKINEEFQIKSSTCPLYVRK